MTIAQQFENRGIQQGMQQGMQQGILEGEARGIEKGRLQEKKLMAKKLWQQRMSLETISQLTDFSAEELEIFLAETTEH